MARAEPGTATSSFFICVNDQPELDFNGRRNPDGQGFAAFGRVIAGMDTVKKIQAMEAENQYLKKPAGHPFHPPGDRSNFDRSAFPALDVPNWDRCRQMRDHLS